MMLLLHLQNYVKYKSVQLLTSYKKIILNWRLHKYIGIFRLLIQMVTIFVQIKYFLFGDVHQRKEGRKEMFY